MQKITSHQPSTILSPVILDINVKCREKCINLQKSISNYVNEITSLLRSKSLLEEKYSQFVVKRINTLASYIYEVDSNPLYNFICLSVVLEVAETHCNEATQMIIDFIEELPKYTGDTLDKERAYFKKRIIILCDKVGQMLTFVEASKNVPLDDLYCQPPDSEDWLTIRSFTRYFEFSTSNVSIENYIGHASKLYYMLAAIGRNAELVPRTEAETNGFLDKAFTDKPSAFPIFYGTNPPKLTEESLDKVNTALIARFLMYARNPEWGQTDGAFFVANPDFRIIRLIFNFPEKAWVRFIRKTFQFPSVKTDTKHYLDTTAFEEIMQQQYLQPGQLRTMPMMLRASNGAPIILSRRHLIGEGLYSKKAGENNVRVRLIFHSKLVKGKSLWKLVKPHDSKSDLASIGLTHVDSKKEEEGHQHMSAADKFKMTVGLAMEQGMEKVDQVEKAMEKEAMELGQQEVQNVSQQRHARRSSKKDTIISENVFKDIKPSTILNQDSPEMTPNFTQKAIPQITPIASSSSRSRETENRYPNIKPSLNPRVKFGVDFDTTNLPELLDKDDREDFKRVIVHVHGGGFVAQSSASHQLYLNRWTNEFKVPIFSIDYRLAPGVQYPVPLDDVICGYLWILNYLEFILQVKPERIVAVGDSAGGNLITGLTAWCIMNSVRAPDALCMFYPAMSTEPDTFTPSLLYSLNDFMLNYSSLKMCSEYYAGAHQARRNPFISPRYLPDDILARFPRCEIYVCDRDPLRDDAIRFALSLHNAGGKVKLNYLKNLSHALLSMSHKSGLPEAVAFFDEAVRSLYELLEKKF
jgi:acetyl esterase/lipase